MTNDERRLLPNLALCEWGDARTEHILRDLDMCARIGVNAISVSERLLPVAASVASATKIYCLTNSEQDAMKPGVAIQSLAGNPSDAAVAAFELAGISHTDWGRIIMARARGAGFLFIDNAGQNLHRFYSFLNLIGDFAGEIQYCAGTNDIAKIEDARRLVAAVRPEFVPRLRLFVSPRFFQNLDFPAQSV